MTEPVKRASMLDYSEAGVLRRRVRRAVRMFLRFGEPARAELDAATAEAKRLAVTDQSVTAGGSFGWHDVTPAAPFADITGNDPANGPGGF